MPDLSDRELADKCARGERPAWVELIRRYDRKVLKVLWDFGGKGELEDLRQEVWARLLAHDARALRGLRAERHGSLGLFLAMTAKSVVLDHLRARKSRPVLEDDPASLRVPDGAATPEENAQEARGKERLVKALETVASESEHPGRDRDILRLHFQEGYSATEIAEMGIGLPAKGVESVLRRSREKLERLLTK